MKNSEPQKFGAHSRRTFLKSLGTAAVTAATVRAQSVAAELEKANAEKIVGPGAVPVTLKVNGQKLKLQLEPRVTLLDALRNYSSLTGAKEGCDRAACGACTVLLDDTPDLFLPETRHRGAGTRNHDRRGPGQGREIIESAAGVH